MNFQKLSLLSVIIDYFRPPGVLRFSPLKPAAGLKSAVCEEASSFILAFGSAWGWAQGLSAPLSVGACGGDRAGGTGLSEVMSSHWLLCLSPVLFWFSYREVSLTTCTLVFSQTSADHRPARLFPHPADIYGPMTCEVLWWAGRLALGVSNLTRPVPTGSAFPSDFLHIHSGWKSGHLHFQIPSDNKFLWLYLL